MLTQAVTELSASLAASPDIDTFWNRIVQQGTPIIESVDTHTVRVTFLWRQPEETEVERVYLDANSLTDHHAEQLSVMQRIGESPVWFYAAEVSNTWRSSYSIIPAPKSVVDEFDYPGAGKEDTTRRTRWLGLLEHRIADPLNPLSAGVDTRRSVAVQPRLLECSRRRTTSAGARRRTLLV
jgi:enterochelin esterase family protein